MIKKIFGFILVALLLFILTRTGLGYLNRREALKKTTAVSEQQLPAIRLGVTPPGSLHLISEVINMQGYDKEFGFKMEVKSIQPQDSTLTLVNNLADVVPLSPLQAARVVSEGKQVRIFAPLMKLVCPFFVKSNSSITGFSELKGKKLATQGPGTGTYNALGTVVGAMGNKIENYFVLTTASFPALPTVLLRGDVDAMTGVCDEVSVGKLLAQGDIKTVGTMEEMMKNVFGSEMQVVSLGLGANESWLIQNPSQAKGLVRAVEKAIIYIRDHPEVYQSERIKKDYELTPEQVNKVMTISKDYQYYNLVSWDKMIENLKVFTKSAIKSSFVPEVPLDNVFIKI